jgi:hypothetical protein
VELLSPFLSIIITSQLSQYAHAQCVTVRTRYLFELCPRGMESVRLLRLRVLLQSRLLPHLQRVSEQMYEFNRFETR